MFVTISLHDYHTITITVDYHADLLQVHGAARSAQVVGVVLRLSGHARASRSHCLHQRVVANRGVAGM